MMRALALSELVAPLQAELIGDDRTFAAVTTDSRAVTQGDLFVALQGENFVGQVAAAHAAGTVVSRDCATPLSRLRLVDTQRALGQICAFNRSLYKGPLVAITGSSGKTTVKNMVRAVLAQKGRTLATEGNFNNEIGVPLTLLALEPGVEYAVVEMGAGKVGEGRNLRRTG